MHQVHRALGYKGLRYRVVNVRSLGERRRVNPAVRKLPVLGYGDALIPDSSFSAADLAVFAPLQLLAAPFTPPTAALVRRPGRRWNWMLRVDRATHSEHTAPLDGACPVA